MAQGQSERQTSPFVQLRWRFASDVVDFAETGENPLTFQNMRSTLADTPLLDRGETDLGANDVQPICLTRTPM